MIKLKNLSPLVSHVKPPRGIWYKFQTSVSTQLGIIYLLVQTKCSLFWVNCCVFFAMYLPSAHVFRREIICTLFSLWQHYGHEEVHHSLTMLACALLCKGCKNRKYNLLLVQSFHPFDQLDHPLFCLNAHWPIYLHWSLQPLSLQTNLLLFMIQNPNHYDQTLPWLLCIQFEINLKKPFSWFWHLKLKITSNTVLMYHLLQRQKSTDVQQENSPPNFTACDLGRVYYMTRGGKIGC